MYIVTVFEVLHGEVVARKLMFLKYRGGIKFCESSGV